MTEPVPKKLLMDLDERATCILTLFQIKFGKMNLCLLIQSLGLLLKKVKIHIEKHKSNLSTSKAIIQACGVNEFEIKKRQ